MSQEDLFAPRARPQQRNVDVVIRETRADGSVVEVRVDAFKSERAVLDVLERIHKGESVAFETKEVGK